MRVPHISSCSLKASLLLPTSARDNQSGKNAVMRFLLCCATVRWCAVSLACMQCSLVNTNIHIISLHLPEQFVIVVVDSTDRERISVTKEELYRMLAHEVSGIKNSRDHSNCMYFDSLSLMWF